MGGGENGGCQVLITGKAEIATFFNEFCNIKHMLVKLEKISKISLQWSLA
jgi:hypothetical protein